MAKVPSTLSQYIVPGKVNIFSITNCPFCVKAKDLFTTLKVDFSTHEVDTNENFKNNKEFIASLNEFCKIKTYPKIVIGETCVGGFSDLDKIYRNMKLFTMLKKEGI